MKKTMIIGAIALAGMAVSGVESRIVGFQQYGDGQGSTVNIGTVFTSTAADGEWTFDAKVFDTAATIGDTVSILNFEIYDLDGYQFAGYDSTGASKGWSYITSDPNTGDPIQQDVQSFTLAKGEVAYCYPGDAVSKFLTYGKVEDVSQSVEISFPGGETSQIVNPFPKDTTLADLETFCQIGDTLSVLNFDLFDLDSYQFAGFDETTGASKGWSYVTSNPETGDPIQRDITDTSLVVIPAGQGGYFLPAGSASRTWTVSF